VSVRPQVIFESPTDKLRILLGDGEPKISEGYGGWDVIDRPKRVGATQWNGKPPFQMEVPLMFDGWADNNSIESVFRRFEEMALPVAERKPPPVLKVTGPIPWGGGNEWVITHIEPTGSLRRRSDGHRVRQSCTVTLRRYVEIERIGQKAASRARGKNKTKGKTGKGRVYIVKKGDTLSSIAAKQLGDASRWREIARLNNIRDPRDIRPGQRLRLP